MSPDGIPLTYIPLDFPELEGKLCMWIPSTLSWKTQAENRCGKQMKMEQQVLIEMLATYGNLGIFT